MREIDRVERDLLRILIGEHESLSLTFNERPSVSRQTVAEYLDSLPGDKDFILPLWINEEERERARQRNSLWVLKCPYGMSIAASSLSAILERIRHPRKGGASKRFDAKAT